MHRGLGCRAPTGAPQGLLPAAPAAVSELRLGGRASAASARPAAGLAIPRGCGLGRAAVRCWAAAGHFVSGSATEPAGKCCCWAGSSSA